MRSDISAPDINRYWINRRRMAWVATVALVAVVLGTLGALYLSIATKTPVEWGGFGFVILGLCGGLCGIIGAYLGLATSFDKKLLASGHIRGQHDDTD